MGRKSVKNGGVCQPLIPLHSYLAGVQGAANIHPSPSIARLPTVAVSPELRRDRTLLVTFALKEIDAPPGIGIVGLPLVGR
jgi:hypothetical protein